MVRFKIGEMDEREKLRNDFRESFFLATFLQF